jgi:hypothetical protein
VVIAGVRFARVSEAQRYGELLALERHGQIRDLTLRLKASDDAGVQVFCGRFTYVDVATGEAKTETTRTNKFSARRVEVDGVVFDSKREARRYRQLQLLERAGEIRELARQVAFVIHAHGGQVVGRYVADFAYTSVATGARAIEDAKGMRTPVYKLKKRLVEAEYGIEIVEV